MSPLLWLMAICTSLSIRLFGINGHLLQLHRAADSLSHCTETEIWGVGGGVDVAQCSPSSG